MNSVPIFPESRPLALEDKAVFTTAFKKFTPVISEFTFTNLFAWRHAYGLCLSQLGNALLVISRGKTRTFIFDPIGPPAIKRATIEQCFALGGPETVFARLPQVTADLFKSNASFRIEGDRDNFDYYYRVKDLIELKGRGYDGKRNFIKRFRESYAYEYRPLTPDSIRDCLSFKEEWCLAKDCLRSEGLTREKEALEEMLHHFQELGVAGGMIEVNGKVEAVTLGEALNPKTFVVHMEKANGSLVGIYQAINQMFCASAAASYHYVNREQDLGVEGLRQAKESYHPCGMVKKYTLTRA